MQKNKTENAKNVPACETKKVPIYKDYFSNSINGFFYWMNIVKENPLSLKNAPKDICDCYQIIYYAVKINGASLEYASDRLRDNFQIVYQAVKDNGNCLLYASFKLRDSKKIVLEAVKNKGLALKYASKRLKKKKDIVMAAVKNCGISLDMADEKLRSKEEIIEAAVFQNGNSIKYALYKNKYSEKHIEHTKKLIFLNPTVFQFLDDKLKNNGDIIMTALIYFPENEKHMDNNVEFNEYIDSILGNERISDDKNKNSKSKKKNKNKKKFPIDEIFENIKSIELLDAVKKEEEKENENKEFDHIDEFDINRFITFQKNENETLFEDYENNFIEDDEGETSANIEVFFNF